MSRPSMVAAIRALADVPGTLADLAYWLRRIALELRETRRLAALRTLANSANCNKCGTRGTYVTHSPTHDKQSEYISAWWCASHKPEGATPHGSEAFTTALVQVARKALEDGPPAETDGAS